MSALVARLDEEDKPRDLRFAVLIAEIAENAGQTRDVLEILRYLHLVHPSWKLTIFSHRVPNASFVPAYVALRRLNGYYAGLLTYPSLAAELRNYDVAYVKGSFPYLKPAVNAGVPSALVVHQIDDPAFIRGPIGKAKTLATNLLVPSVTRMADVVLTITDELASFYARSYGVQPVVIEDIISPKFYDTTSTERTPDPRQGERLLSVGYWDGQGGRKRQDMLIRLLKEVSGSLANAHLTLAGLSDSSRAVLLKIAEREGVSDRVALLGILGEDDLVRVYRQNDIYVTATTVEGFYRQAIEAFASGMPVIGFDSRKVVRDPSQAASANHVVKSLGGELFTDSSSFVRAVGRVTENYASYSNRAKAYAGRFTAEVLGPKTEKVLVALSGRNVSAR